MSSMRNAVQRRPHRERAQPLERRRLGLLEKHKDYSQRAKDYNKKKETIKSLRQKAADRNEDEFYYGMMSRKGPGSKIQDGRSWSGTAQGDRGNKALSMDTVRLLKTQDVGYIRTMRQLATKEVAQLEERVVLAKGLDHLDEDDGDEDFEDDSDEEVFAKPTKPKAPRKIVFLEDEDDREMALEQLVQDDESDKLSDEKTQAKEEREEQRLKAAKRSRLQLEAARKKLKALTDAENALDVQRAKMGKTATSGGYTRRGKKIMVRQRKR
ncbi:hypothetical protein S7711_02600 [Stachybotrys chartarum IBT 7711]|uniref:U3 small nucleolar RNA-associated protein 11 n=1 Tax=Stachybotrys chartarum (strain CBS 109288 / IBT 7711) TaxID=1280523 RepID=A0A084B8X8_STACB|nr:hypothetical protein S7711_02600 [Stachybotrys chartarum IBT 7711]KFA56047.1 hypothetical protein S40293_00216 [Stachybotrys chartarum IBT 40293]KFA81287.1 hypothetical protein S40288_04858 [Stachybotrys chartarum IBT 40288]